jgi:hypothetical protein
LALVSTSGTTSVPWFVYAALALDRLDEHGGGLWTDQCFCGFEIAEGGVDYPWQHRTKAIL